MPADSPELMQQITEWAKIILEWVGFGTLTGLLAKAIMPGKDPGGASVKSSSRGRWRWDQIPIRGLRASRANSIPASF